MRYYSKSWSQKRIVRVSGRFFFSKTINNLRSRKPIKHFRIHLAACRGFLADREKLVKNITL